MLSPTHSHSLPGGYHTYVLYSTPSDGFETTTYRAAVDGIVKVSMLIMFLNVFYYINIDKLNLVLTSVQF